MDDEVLEVNGKQYVLDGEHTRIVTVKKIDEDDLPEGNGLWVDVEEGRYYFDAEEERIWNSFEDIIPWKDGKENPDYSTFEEDFCTYHELDPEIVRGIGSGLG